MEYLLWRSMHDITAPRLVEGLLNQDHVDPDLVQFIKDTFGEESLLYKSLFALNKTEAHQGNR